MYFIYYVLSWLCIKKGVFLYIYFVAYFCFESEIWFFNMRLFSIDTKKRIFATCFSFFWRRYLIYNYLNWNLIYSDVSHRFSASLAHTSCIQPLASLRIRFASAPRCCRVLVTCSRRSIPPKFICCDRFCTHSSSSCIVVSSVRVRVFFCVCAYSSLQHTTPRLIAMKGVFALTWAAHTLGVCVPVCVCV